uniref:CCHC-type domain-containing protein n=1 Tax=Lactuca sativa TaxID=4236 RepID=A0A9R1XE93_LACSA|nr:hypothetical protein LSAT_V11C400218310 [Lactuca sativa]
MVDGEGSKNQKKSTGKRKFKGKDDKYSKKKAKVLCWNCNKPGHFKKYCRFCKVNKDGAGPIGSKDPEKKQDDNVAWWVDSGATSHGCKDLYLFKDFQRIEDGSVVGSVLLTFNFGKRLFLNNVLYIPGMCKNLVFEIVLNNCDYKQILENDKNILSRHGSFMVLGYVYNGMIRLNINYPSLVNSIFMDSTSTSNNFNKYELWHARLGQIH